MDSNNKKYGYIFIVVLVIIIAIVMYFIFNNKSSEDNNPQNTSENNVARLATESDSNEKLNEINNKVANVISNSTVKEEELASYSTELGGSTENRLTNIRITCDKLNGTIVSAGDTFSFCELVGPSTAEEGYKEATVIVDGEKVQALGGR